MILKNITLAFILFSFCSCNSNKKDGIETAEDISKSIAEATENTISFEGKFIKIEKINSREYYLFLKDDQDSIISFLTLMPLSQDEIEMLKPEGNNIELKYEPFYNPVRKKTEKVVKFIHPVYEFEKK